MSLKFPDVLEHANDNYPLVDINSMEGIGSVIDKITRNSIPINKRKNLFVCQVGTDRHVYLHTLLTDEHWQNDLNWRVDKDIFLMKDASNMTEQEILAFKQALSLNTDDVDGLDELLLSGIKFVEPCIDLVSELPTLNLVVGDRYLLTSDNSINEWDGTEWIKTIATSGLTTWIVNDITTPINDKGWYRFNGVTWIYIGQPYDHAELINVNGNGDYHLSEAEQIALVEGNDADGYHIHDSLAKRDGSNLTLTNYQDFNTKSYINRTSAITYYIETTGSDDNNGLTVGTAFKTLERAFKEISNQHLSAIVTLQLGVGEFLVDPNTIAKYSRNITSSGTTSTGINIVGTFTEYATGLNITDIPGRANIRNYSGLALTTNQLQGKFLSGGTNYHPIGGNKDSDIFASSNIVAGTNKVVYQLATIIKFTANGFIPKSENLTLTINNAQIIGTTTSIVFILFSSRYFFFHCHFLNPIQSQFNRSVFSRFVRCIFGRMTYTELTIELPTANISGSIFINGGGRFNGCVNISLAGGCMWVNSSMGFIQSTNISFPLSSACSFIDTDGPNGNAYDTALWYDAVNCKFNIPLCETYGYVRVALVTGTSWYRNATDFKLDVEVKAYDSVSYPLKFILPTNTFTKEPPFALEQGRRVYIEGQTDMFLGESYEYEYSVGTGGDFADIILLQEFLNKNKYIKNVVVNFVSDSIDLHTVYFKELNNLVINQGEYLNQLDLYVDNCTAFTLNSDYEGEIGTNIYLTSIAMVAIYVNAIHIFNISDCKDVELYWNDMQYRRLRVKNSSVKCYNPYIDIEFNIYDSSVQLIGEGLLNILPNFTGINTVILSDLIGLSLLPTEYTKTFHSDVDGSLFWIVGNKGVFITDEDAVDLSTDQIIKSGIKTFNQYPQKKVYEIGDVGPAGGLIALIDTSVTPNVYYELAPTSAGSFAFKTVQTVSLGTSTAIGTGKTNTVALSGTLHPAAEACRNYYSGGFADWFLPSINELVDALNNVAVTPEQRAILGIPINSIITWSSSDFNQQDAYSAFYTAVPSYASVDSVDKNVAYPVRPMRSFTGGVPLPVNENEFITKSYCDTKIVEYFENITPLVINKEVVLSENTTIDDFFPAGYKLFSIFAHNLSNNSIADLLIEDDIVIAPNYLGGYTGLIGGGKAVYTPGPPYSAGDIGDVYYTYTQRADVYEASRSLTASCSNWNSAQVKIRFTFVKF